MSVVATCHVRRCSQPPSMTSWKSSRPAAPDREHRCGDIFGPVGVAVDQPHASNRRGQCSVTPIRETPLPSRWRHTPQAMSGDPSFITSKAPPGGKSDKKLMKILMGWKPGGLNVANHRSLPRHRPVNIVGAHHALPPRLEFRLQALGHSPPFAA